MKKICIMPLILLIVILMSLKAVDASISIGASPGVLVYKGVLKGGYAYKAVTVSTSREDEILIDVIKEGEISDWIEIEENSTIFNVSRDNPFTFGVVIRPPLTAANGNYSSVLHIRTGTLGVIGSARFGTAVKADITVKIKVEVTGQEITSCLVAGASVGDAEQGQDIPIVATVLNEGNVMLVPRFEVFIYDQEQKELLLSESFDRDSVLPTISQRVVMLLKNQLPLGQYWINVVSEGCGFKKTMTFDIVEPGALADKGELMRIEVKPWVVTNETVEIKSIFKNTGARSQDVKVVLEIKKSGKLVKTMTSETLLVLAGDTQEFKSYFTPMTAGKYEVRAKAYYNKKVTFEKGNIINVNELVSEKKSGWLIYLVYAIILILIVAVARKIIKEKRRMRRW